MNETIIKAKNAERLLNDPVLKGAFADIKQTLIKQFEDAPIRDREGVHEIKIMMRMLLALEQTLVNYVNDGKITEINLKDPNERKRHI